MVVHAFVDAVCAQLLYYNGKILTYDGCELCISRIIVKRRAHQASETSNFDGGVMIRRAPRNSQAKEYMSVAVILRSDRSPWLPLSVQFLSIF